MADLRIGADGIPLMTAVEARGYIAEHLGEPGFVLLDVRTPPEIEEAHIEGCRRLDLYSELPARLPELDPQADYLLVCRSGNRSGYVAGVMQQLGFRRAVNLEGGMLAWRRQGFPVASGGVDSL